MASDFWTDSRGTQYPLRTDIHKHCPKGHKLLSRIASVTEVPALCNFCFKHIVQSAWAGDVKFCSVDSCHFIICASCSSILQGNSELFAKSQTCEDLGTFSSLNGIRISWLHWLKKNWGKQYRDWTTEEAVNMLFRPRTFISRRTFCEELAVDGDLQHFTAPANRFVCHTWKSSFSGLIDGLLDTIHDNEASLWIDAFSMYLHQLQISKNLVFHFDDIKCIMSRMKSFSLSLQPLMNPTIFENRWCLFEAIMFLEVQPSGAIDVCLSPEEFLQLSSQLHVSSYASSIEKVFASIQLSNSICTHYIRAPADVLVPCGSSSTCFRLNEIAFNGVRSWLIKIMMLHVDKGIQKHDDFYLNSLMTAVNHFFQATYDSASLVPFVVKFLKYKRARFGEFHIETVVQMFEHAKLAHKLQRFHEAAALCHRCLHIKGVISGQEDTTVLSLKNELAAILLKFNSIDSAHKLLDTCVLNRRLLLGDNHADTLDSEFYLASVLCLKSHFNAALILIEKCLQKRTCLFGSDHPITLQTFSCKAQLAFKCVSHGKSNNSDLKFSRMEVERMFTICLAKQEFILGKVHEDTILTRNNLALACSAFGDLRRARAFFSECLEGIQLRLGATHLSRFSTMRCSASVAVSSGEVHVAEQLYTECLLNVRKLFGIEHPTTLMTIEDLGHVYVLMQRFEDALLLFQECSNAWISMGQPSRSLSIDMYRAATLRKQGNLSQAHIVAYESLSESHNQLGPAHSTTLGLEVELADILLAASRWLEAKVLFKKVVDKKLSVDGPEDVSVIRLMIKLANVYEKLNKFSKSRNLLTFVYNYFVQALGDYHPDAVDSMSKLAWYMYLCDDLEDCEAMAMACLDRCGRPGLQNVVDQQHLKSIVDAVRRRRARIMSFEKESGDDLVMAMNLSMSMK